MFLSYFVNRVSAWRRRSDYFDSTAERLERRADRFARAHRAQQSGNDELLNAIAEFMKVLGRANRSGGRVTIFVVVLTVVNVIAVVFQIRDARRFVSVQNNIELSDELFNNDLNRSVFESIDAKAHLLKRAGGKFTDSQLDHYLATFDTIDAAYEDGQLSERYMCDSFSYSIVTTFRYPEIRRYIAEQRKSDSGWFIGLDNLYKAVENSNDPQCI